MYFGKYFIQDQYDYHTINIVFYMPLTQQHFFVVCEVAYLLDVYAYDCLTYAISFEHQLSAMSLNKLII